MSKKKRPYGQLHTAEYESPKLVEVDLPIIEPLTEHEKDEQFIESSHESKSPKITTEELYAEYDRLSVFKSYKDKLFDLLQGFGDKDCTLSNIELHNQLGISQRTIRQHLAELELDGVISRSFPAPNKRVIAVNNPAKSYDW